jgi:adenosylcobinamide-GDP ribazoletransferase
MGSRGPINGLIDAVTFLTRVPLRTREQDEASIARAVPWFPVVGALVGLLVAAVYAGVLYLLPSFIAAALAVACGLLVTGAFHEDGLADVADAFGGGRDRDDRLRILKDPRLGTFGVLAVVFAALLRVGAVSAFTRTDALLAIPAAHALSRAASIAAMGAFRPVDEGLGASYTRALTRGRVVIGVIAGAAIASALLRIWVVPAAALGALVVLLLGRLARSRIGGINGDVLGAIQQLTEIGVLLAVTALVVRGYKLY